MFRSPPRSTSSQRGQATPEYVGLVLLVAAVLAAALAMTATVLPATALAKALASRLLCTVHSKSGCAPSPLDPSPLELAYGTELAATLAEHAPEISFEDGDFVSLPVDFRDCRERSCSDSIRHGSLARTQTGLPPVTYTHVVDCARPGAAARRRL